MLQSVRTIRSNIQNICAKSLKQIHGAQLLDVTKIMIDINLLDTKPIGIIHIVHTKCMTPDNFQTLSAFDCANYKQTVENYQCDLCKAVCSIANPVYTNPSNQGADLCKICMEKAFQTVCPQVDWIPGPVYSLAEIKRAVDL
jgi:hypothetical protein